MSLEILFEDNYLVVCRKKAGVPVETARIGAEDMVSQLRNYFYETTKNSYTGVIHRLDQPVEGLLVFAKTPEAAAALSRQAAGQDMKKQYLAAVCGKPEEKQGVLVDYLVKNARTNTSCIADRQTKGAKRCELFYRVLEEKEGCSLVEIELKTGRHHQIRVQMAGHGMPLFGDSKYHPDFQGRPGVMPALCAYKLSFIHPAAKRRAEFTVPPEHEVFKQFACYGSFHKQ